jgi:hypothetical protein
MENKKTLILNTEYECTSSCCCSERVEELDDPSLEAIVSVYLILGFGGSLVGFGFHLLSMKP